MSEKDEGWDMPDDEYHGHGCIDRMREQAGLPPLREKSAAAPTPVPTEEELILIRGCQVAEHSPGVKLWICGACVRAAIQQAVEEEREACAVAALESGQDCNQHPPNCHAFVAADIRERGRRG